MGEIKQQMEKLDERVTTAGNSGSATEDRSIRQERDVGYLLKTEASLMAKRHGKQTLAQQYQAVWDTRGHREKRQPGATQWAVAIALRAYTWQNCKVWYSIRNIAGLIANSI